jgi:hypothetical protein
LQVEEVGDSAVSRQFNPSEKLAGDKPMAKNVNERADYFAGNGF